MKRPREDIGTADTAAQIPVVTPDTRGDTDTIPPSEALSADLILLHCELEENLPITIQSIQRNGDTVIVNALSNVKNDRDTEDRLSFAIVKHYRGITIHGTGNVFTFNVPRGGRMQKVSLIIQD